VRTRRTTGDLRITMNKGLCREQEMLWDEGMADANVSAAFTPAYTSDRGAF
jgi:hypothetical protein